MFEPNKTTIGTSQQNTESMFCPAFAAGYLIGLVFPIQVLDGIDPKTSDQLPQGPSPAV